MDEPGDGVRVIREARPLSVATVLPVLAGIALLAGIGWFVLSVAPSPSASGRDVPADVAPAPGIPVTVTPQAAPGIPPPPARTPPAQAMESTPSPDDLPSGDPNDIATYVSATDPEPTAAEVIQALHDIGDHTGIGAFNPPGTSPPIRGLAVPEDFVLPPGYVRHHQVTDEGEPLEPILMFSPDVSFVDASGRAVPIPESRVVPPEMAPPGLPIRVIAIPPKP